MKIIANAIIFVSNHSPNPFVVTIIIPLHICKVSTLPLRNISYLDIAEINAIQQRAMAEYDLYRKKTDEELSEVEKQFIESIEQADKKLKSYNKKK